jgi:hypothetical protein
MEVIVCKYAFSGCNFTSKRRRITLHEDDTRSHAGSLQKVFQDAEEEISQLKLRMIEQKNAAEDAEKELSSLKLNMTYLMDAAWKTFRRHSMRA